MDRVAGQCLEALHKPFSAMRDLSLPFLRERGFTSERSAVILGDFRHRLFCTIVQHRAEQIREIVISDGPPGSRIAAELHLDHPLCSMLP